jgi:hypothetical protein
VRLGADPTAEAGKEAVHADMGCQVWLASVGIQARRQMSKP